MASAPSGFDAAASQITALILAGGQGSRLGGVDKGWLPLDGRGLIEHVFAAIAPQVGAVLISANRNLERYRALGVPVLSDPYDGSLGPLVGMLAGLKAAETPLMLTIPCDAPNTCADYAERLWSGLDAADAEVAMAHDGERLQPVHALLRCDLGDELEAAVRGGQRSVNRWFRTRRAISVDFSDRPETFRSINTPEDYAVLRAGESG